MPNNQQPMPDLPEVTPDMDPEPAKQIKENQEYRMSLEKLKQMAQDPEIIKELNKSDPAATAPPVTDGKFCSICGAKNALEAKFCINCGARFG